MRAYEFLAEDSKTLKLPNMNVGDEVKVGKFKNRKAEIKGFTKDDHGQPVLKTTKGDQKLFKPRISKLEPKNEAHELTEYQILKTDNYNIMKNPSDADLRILLKKYKEIRGLSIGKSLYVWDAFVATHNNVYNELSSDDGNVMSYYFSLSKDANDDMWDMEEYSTRKYPDTIYIGSEFGENDFNHPMVKRALG